MTPAVVQALVLGAALTALLVVLALWLRLGWRRRSRARAVVVRLVLAMAATGYALLALELGVYAFLDRSDSFGYTLAAKRWFAKHWRPLNSLQIRDVEHDPSALAAKRVVYVVGDSLVAGHGVRDPADRFANVLSARLGSDYEVVVLAKCGWHTIDELEAMRAYPAQPEVVVLSYYFNDVEHAVAAHGLRAPEPFAPPPPALRPLVQRSHLLNFVYWRVYRFANAAEIDRRAWAFFQDVWLRPDVWATHRAELLSVVDFARQRGSRLIVAVFPQLREVERSRPYTARVVELMREQQVEVLDLTEHLAGRDPDDLIVGPLDNHPGVALHHEVGELLFERISQPAPGTAR
jgi:hypothetical protein